MSLADDAERLRDIALSVLSADLERGQRLRLRVGPLYADFSRQLVDVAALDTLLAVADHAELARFRRAFADGEPLNTTEGRAALHHSLRARADDVPEGSMRSAQAAATEASSRVQVWVRRLLDEGLGESQPVRDVVNVGIGGSDLGPRLLDAAIADPIHGPRLHFVSSIDAHRAADLIATLDPATTVVVLVSKSFHTEETLLNGRLFVDWLTAALGEAAMQRRVFAVTANVEAAQRFGVDGERCLPIWEWVGGRYSLWSAVGFSFALAHGIDTFRRLLDGAREMDRHFFSAPLAQNLPVLRGLIEHWNRVAREFRSRCVVPYDVRLTHLPAYLQQLEMESNGKSVRHDGVPVDLPTAPIIWGGVGTDAQHAFFQALHQGTQVVPVEFIGIIQPAHRHDAHHRVLLANLLAQSAALAYGDDTRDSDDPLAAHKHHGGNRPSTVILLDALTPEALGALLAMYEHSVFVEACLVGINPFDQWGVELGKRIAKDFLPALSSETAASTLDPVTQALIREIRSR
ncbi:MAG TPA: glucose-6-phosphate isomerase [Pseudomonadota bacterium]|nr:glucose-6-phosphate isomerase [Rhodanobacteraceae bacterium]MBP9154499.1 glucose-6-phosphate isomerase [Xanthomonadales bacterium]HQW80591.1 glucose-6-phosphate isomerase [Pseudomonadota bacterium]